MNYLGYVVAAYAVFIGLLAIDAIGSHLRLRRARQNARQRQQRQQARRSASTGNGAPLELER